jgi:hypothetical protein
MSLATTPATTETMVIVPQSDMAGIIKLDQCARAAASELVAAEQAGNQMAKALISARAMKLIRGLLTDKLMADVMELQGTALGFKTDKDRDGGYKVDEVRDVMVSALILGLRPTGNEINIIANNLYVTKEGFSRLLSEFAGLTDLNIQMGVPVSVGDAGALVPARASWRINGTHQEMICEKNETSDYRIPIRVNKAMGTDAILGKAESKILRRIYKRITGTVLGVDEDEDEGQQGAGPAQDGQTVGMQAKQ